MLFISSIINKFVPLSERSFPLTERIFPLTERSFPLTDSSFPPAVRLFPLSERLFPLSVRLFPLSVRLSPLTERSFPLIRSLFPLIANSLRQLQIESFCSISGQDINATNYNTVNKVNKLVTVFALPLHLDRFLTARVTGLAHLLAI
jgi:hypothetical protein